MKLKFWGTRGSCAVSRQDSMLFGGRTSCIQIETGSHQLIFDGGTGMTELGYVFPEKHAHIFLTHYHWDHVLGFLFFSPFHAGDAHFDIYGEDREGRTCRSILSDIFNEPYFPIAFEDYKARLDFHDFEGRAVLIREPDLKVSTFPLIHPGGSVAYCIEAEGRKIVYCTDTEKLTSAEFIDFIINADVLIYDSHFTEEDYIPNWGHSTALAGTELANLANVRYLFPFHHAEMRKDVELLQTEVRMMQHFQNTIFARDGMTLTWENGAFTVGTD